MQKYSFKGTILIFISSLLIIQSFIGIMVLPKFVPSVILQVLISAATFILLSIILLQPILNSVLKDIQSLGKVLKHYRDGDFIYEGDEIRWRELSYISSCLEDLQGIFKDWVYQVIKSSSILKDYSEEFSSSANQTAESYELMSQGLNNLVDSSIEINDQVSQNAASSQELYSSSSLVASASSQALDSTRDMKNFTQQSIQGIQDSIKSIDQLNALFQNSSNNITQLVELVGNISIMSDSITNIAEQTNLLSLNAAIEAARAGEFGKGFSVVANEVRNLAENSRHAAQEINQMIEMISKQAKTTVENMDVGVKQVKINQELSYEASKNLDFILEKINGIYQLVSDIASNIKEQSLSAENVATVTEEIAAFSQDTNETALALREDITRQHRYIQDNVNMAMKIEETLSHLKNFTKQFDDTIGQQLIDFCHKLGDEVAQGRIDSTALEEISNKTGITEFYITDQEGVTVLSNNPQGIGFAFQDDPNTQAYDFFQILKDPSLEVVQPVQKRDIDGQYFKFVGVSRKDGRGIIQAGLSIDDIRKFKGAYALQ